MSATVLINSIYRSSEGEGVHIGTPQIFIRFQGCHVGCLNCDSKETWEFSPESTYSVDEVMEKVEFLSQNIIKRVSITGGDPLHPSQIPGLRILISELKSRHYYINIEAAGTRIVEDIFDQVDFISFDFKTPSTSVKTSFHVLKNFILNYNHKSQIKAVIADKKDFEATYDVFKRLNDQNISPLIWCLTPCYDSGEDFPAKRFQHVVKLNEEFGLPFRVIGQQHKWLYGSSEKFV